MYSLSVNTENFVSSFKSAQDKFPGEVLAALERTAELAASFAKTSTLYRSHTFGLQKSISWKASINSRTGRASITAKARYASFVEFGTAAHTIEPRRKKVLRFVQNGAVRFARIVRHPGTAPRPFMKQAQDRATPLLERLMGEAVAKAFT